MGACLFQRFCPNLGILLCGNDIIAHASLQQALLLTGISIEYCVVWYSPVPVIIGTRTKNIKHRRYHSWQLVFWNPVDSREILQIIMNPLMNPADLHEKHRFSYEKCHFSWKVLHFMKSLLFIWKAPLFMKCSTFQSEMRCFSWKAALFIWKAPLFMKSTAFHCELFGYHQV